MPPPSATDALAFNDLPMRRRRRSLPARSLSDAPASPPNATTLLETIVTSAVELYSRLVRLALPVVFTPSSQVFEWHDDGAKFAEISTDENGKWCYSYDDVSTECSSDDWRSDQDTSETDDDEEEQDGLELETRAARVLSVASYCPDESDLVVQHYLCPCGKCAQYDVIAADVARVVTWRDATGVASITRLLQAFSTYNEAIGYHIDMIETADECLSTWSGDEDQAFTSFVMLQDVVPFLCANAV